MFFSVLIYNNVSRQIEGLIRMQNNRIRSFQFKRRDSALSEDLKKEKRQLGYTLILLNLAIITAASGAGYFLAGRTLFPIKLMIDEQNQFISDASHELRTPIATLRAEMEGKLLEKNISDEAARKLISSNLEELETLQNLANGLLKLTQIHTLEDANEHAEKISLLEIVKLARAKVLPLAKNKKIEIEIKMSEIIIKGNKNNLIEVFVILLDNAIKYSKKNTKITVSLEKLEHEVRILFSDRGIGISEKDLPHIFERFFRADKSRSQADGYGLGLSIAKKLIEKHRGLIYATSVVGKGSVFTVRLPLFI